VIHTEFGVWRLRPVGEGDSEWLAGRGGVAVEELRRLAALAFAWP
jgi:hypothetical protein